MKRRRIDRRQEVPDDIMENALYIARDSVDVALRFFDAVEETIKGLAAMPRKGKMVEFEEPRLAGVRSYAVRGFRNHLIFYRATADGIDVIAVFHGARNLPVALRRRV